MTVKKKTELLTLLKDFTRFGCFTFGGGLSIIAQMQRLYVEQRREITSDELLDLTSVAKSLPGTMIANVAMLYGYRVGGIAGGLTALLGMTMPPMMVMLVISSFYKAFRDNYWVGAAMSGAQAAVVPIIIGAALGMIRGSIRNVPCLMVTLVCGVLYFFFQVNTVVLVVIGLLSGLAMSEYYERKEARGRDLS